MVEAKEEDLVAEEAEEHAQTMIIEEDIAMAENDNNNIIHNGGIKPRGQRQTKTKMRKRGRRLKRRVTWWRRMESAFRRWMLRRTKQRQKKLAPPPATNLPEKLSPSSSRQKENEQSIKRLRDILQQCHRYHQIKGKRGG